MLRNHIFCALVSCSLISKTYTISVCFPVFSSLSFVAQQFTTPLDSVRELKLLCQQNKNTCIDIFVYYLFCDKIFSQV